MSMSADEEGAMEGIADQATEEEEFGSEEIEYVSYGGEQHLPLVMKLVDEELSEPYSIFTYRYFVYIWPNLTFLVRDSHLPFFLFRVSGLFCMTLVGDLVYTEMVSISVGSERLVCI